MARILCVAAFAILPSAASLAQPAPDSGAASRWRVARLAATQVKTAAPIAAFHVVDGRPPVRVTGQPPPRLGPGDIVVESTASAAARVPSDPGTSWVLPVRIRIQDRRGQEVSLVPWLTVQGGGLRWNAAAGVFRGTIGIALVDADDSAGGSHPLSAPISVSFTGDASAYAPPDIRLDHTYAPLAYVQVETDRAADTLRVSAFAASAKDPVHVDVPVIPEALRVVATPREIQGFGLEVTRLVLTGPPSTPTRKSVMSVTADKATPEPQEVVLDADGLGTAVLRSRGVGTATVTARLAPLGETTATVTFEHPWPFGVAALVGAFLGALIAMLKRWAKPGPALVTLVLGVLVGLVVALAYGAGVNLSGLKLTAAYGEAAVCVFAALGALAGPKVLRLKPA